MLVKEQMNIPDCATLKVRCKRDKRIYLFGYIWLYYLTLLSMSDFSFGNIEQATLYLWMRLSGGTC